MRKTCHTCKHHSISSSDEPCCTCMSVTNYDRWEPDINTNEFPFTDADRELFMRAMKPDEFDRQAEQAPVAAQAQEGGAKQTDGKLPLQLTPWLSVMEMVRVLEFGAQKYDSWNWSKGLSFMGCIASTMRHLIKFISGQDNDDESGLSHIAHAMCNCAFLLHFVKMGGGTDDRPAALAGMMDKLSVPDAELWAKYSNVMGIDK